MTRSLRKREVEALLAGYDADPVMALTIALRVVLDQPDATFEQLLASAPIDAERRSHLLARLESALDSLAAELNETRTLGS